MAKINIDKEATFITGGVEVFTESFVWKVNDFFEVANLGGQFGHVQIDAWKDNEKLASKWKISLSLRANNFTCEWYTYYLVKILFSPESADFQNASVKITCVIKCNNGNDCVQRSGMCKILQIQEQPIQFGYMQMPIASNLVDINQCLTMHWTLELLKPKLNSKGDMNNWNDCTTSLCCFQSAAKAKAAKDIMGYADRAGTRHMVEIIAMDGVKLRAPKYILEARSSVMEAMFRQAMKEEKTGRVHIADISSKPLIILIHFITKGELLPEWNMKSVILNLVYAAHKYKIMDLLEFLDNNMGKYCELATAGDFIATAQKLSLFTAEKHILEFIRENAANSAEDLEKFVKGFRDEKYFRM